MKACLLPKYFSVPWEIWTKFSFKNDTCCLDELPKGNLLSSISWVNVDSRFQISHGSFLISSTDAVTAEGTSSLLRVKLGLGSTFYVGMYSYSSSSRALPSNSFSAISTKSGLGLIKYMSKWLPIHFVVTTNWSTSRMCSSLWIIIRHSIGELWLIPILLASPHLHIAEWHHHGVNEGIVTFSCLLLQDELVYYSTACCSTILYKNSIKSITITWKGTTRWP